MKMKPRARWWIVSTHVLTTGLAMPFVASAIGLFLIALLGLRGMAALMLILGIEAIEYIGGTSRINTNRSQGFTEAWN